MVDAYIANPIEPLHTEILQMLELWQNNHNNLEKIIQESPILREIESMSKDLEIISGIGIKAIQNLKNKSKNNQDWITYSLQKIEKTKVPRGQTELKVISGIEKLVRFASESY